VSSYCRYAPFLFLYRLVVPGVLPLLCRDLHGQLLSWLSLALGLVVVCWACDGPEERGRDLIEEK
jgi:hypothetical protein